MYTLRKVLSLLLNLNQESMLMAWGNVEFSIMKKMLCIRFCVAYVFNKTKYLFLFFNKTSIFENNLTVFFPFSLKR